MNREQLKALAQETLEISQTRHYQAQGYEVTYDPGRPTELWTSEALDKLVESAQRSAEWAPRPMEVRNEGTVDAIFRLSERNPVSYHLGVLNFASAKNPGGGFLNGSVAQEECLAYCSDLYQTQVTGQGPRYYEINRAYRDPVYTDTMLIGDVTFFRTSDYALTDLYVTCPVITAPAVNMGTVIRNGGSVERAKSIMKGRMEKILALFHHSGCTDLILGAYGCGVFRNDPEDVARFWQELLVDEGWGQCFDRVTFSILERPGRDTNTAPFRRRFG